MLNHRDEVQEFRVTDIIRRGRIRSFAIYAVYADGTAYRVALHTQDISHSKELFDFHHSEMKRIYTSLS